MTDTDEFFTSAARLGASAFDAWFSIFKGLAVATAEVVNPDDLVLAENAVVVDVKPRAAGALCVGWFTPTPLPPPNPSATVPLAAPPDGTTDVLSPDLLSLSPAGLRPPTWAAGADPTKDPPLPQKVKLWVTKPSALPATVIGGTYHGALYAHGDLGRPVARTSLTVVRHSPGPTGNK